MDLSIVKRIFLLGFVLMIGSGLGYADVIFTLGNNPQPGEANIVLNNPTIATTIQATVFGVPGITVNFTSTQSLLEPATGLARITGLPEGFPLKNIDISLADSYTYGG